MSRIGRMPVTIPAGVEVSVAEGNVVTVKGPKGTLTQAMRPEMSIKIENNELKVDRPSEDKLHKSLHGLTRSLIHDMVFIVFITNAERRIPVQYAKRVVGRKVYGGQSTHLPIKVNMIKDVTPIPHNGCRPPKRRRV